VEDKSTELPAPLHNVSVKLFQPGTAHFYRYGEGMPAPLEALHHDMFGVSTAEGISVVLMPAVESPPEDWEALQPDDVDVITTQAEARIFAALMCDVVVMGSTLDGSELEGRRSQVELVGGPTIVTVSHSEFRRFLVDARRSADRCTSVNHFIRLDTCASFGTFIAEHVVPRPESTTSGPDC
jgi:hypothetical protein